MFASAFLFLIVAPAQVEAAPKVRAAATELDLGQVRVGDVLARSLKLENVGDQVLTISRIESSCSVCSSGSVGKTALEPGEETDLNVTFKATAKTAEKERQQVTLTIRSNDPDRSGLEIRVAATVLPTKATEDKPSEQLRQALRGKWLSPAEWAQVIEGLPAEPTSTSYELAEIVSGWAWGPSFQPIPADGVISVSVAGGDGAHKRPEVERNALPDKALAIGIGAGGSRLARMLAREFPGVSPAAVETLRHPSAGASSETRWTAELLLAELALSEGKLCEAASVYQKLLDDAAFADTFLTAEGQYAPYSSDMGWHAARRVWRLCQIYWLLGEHEKCLAAVEKGMERFGDARWIRWADILVPLAAKCSAAGDTQRAKRSYELLMRYIPSGHERAAATERSRAMRRAEDDADGVKDGEKAPEKVEKDTTKHYK